MRTAATVVLAHSRWCFLDRRCYCVRDSLSSMMTSKTFLKFWIEANPLNVGGIALSHPKGRYSEPLTHQASNQRSSRRSSV